MINQTKRKQRRSKIKRKLLKFVDNNDNERNGNKIVISKTFKRLLID